MKRALSLYCIFSLVIVILTGVYIYLVNQDKLASLAYIQDIEWSRWHPVLPTGQPTGLYEGALDRAGRFHLSMVEYSKDRAIGEMLHTIVNADGKVVQKPQVILENPRLFEAAMLIHDDLLHIFWVGASEQDQLEMYYSTSDFSGQILTQRTLICAEEDLERMEGLKVAYSNGDFLVVWVANVEVKQVKSLLIHADGQTSGKIVALSDGTLPSVKPVLAADETGHYHVAWLQRHYLENTQGGLYHLMYLSLNEEGQPLFAPRVLEQAASNPLAMAIGNEQVYLTFAQAQPLSFKDVDSLDELLPRYNLYGFSIPVAGPAAVTETIRLTEQRGPSFHQSLAVDTEGLVHLVYYDLYKDELILTHEVLSMDLRNEVKAPNLIFPDMPINYNTGQLRLKYGTILVPDREKGVHLTWLNSSSRGGSYFYYANSRKPGKISPLAVIGLDQSHLLTSFLMSLLYTLGVPWTNVIGFTLVFVFLMIALLAFVIWLVKKQSWGKWIDNYYTVAAVICLLHTWVVDKVNWEKAFFWPTQPDPGQIWYIYGAATLMAVVYLLLNQHSKFKSITLGGITAFFWVYWVNVITLMFYIPRAIIG